MKANRRRTQIATVIGTFVLGTALVGNPVVVQQQQQAVQIARKTRGVQDVKDELRIDQAAVEQRRNVEVEDDALAKQVATKLADETFPLAEAEEGWLFGWGVEGSNWEFDVEVDEGIITLEDDVDSYGDITEAVTAVRAGPGVRAVESELRIAYFGYRGYYHPYYYGPYRGPYYGPYDSPYN